MQIQKIYVLYFSPTGGSKKAATAVSSALAPLSPNREAQIIDITCDRTQEIPPFHKDDLLIVGLPVYAGRIPALAEPVIKNLRGDGTPCVPLVVYGNRAFDDALLELSEDLQESGFIPVSAGAFVGEHSYGTSIATGRPNEKDLETAKALGENVLQKLSSLESAAMLPALSIPGNHPYKERPSAPETAWAPETRDDCIECGQCAELCPVQIIDPKNLHTVTAPEKCLHCFACVKGCPTGAKFSEAAPLKMFLAFLTANCTAVQHQPQLFT